MDAHWVLTGCIFALLSGVYIIGYRHGMDHVYRQVARFQDWVEKRRK